MMFTPPWSPTISTGDDKYKVLVLHREYDNVCVVRLSGFSNNVFWKEIKLNRPFAWTRIQKAKDAARKKADKLRRQDLDAKHTYEIAKGDP